MTTTYNNASDKDKVFQNAIDECFRDISEQIRSLQKALANHRHDFNYRLSHLEDLLKICYYCTSAQFTNGHAHHDLEIMGVHRTNCCSSYDKKLACTYTSGILNVQ